MSVFYEQLGRKLPKGTVVSVGEGEPLLEKLIRGESLAGERCFLAGEAPRVGLIHEQPAGMDKTACNYAYIAEIWPQLDWYLDGGDFYVGVQTKRGCPHNCCYCVYTVVEGKAVRVNPVEEVIAEMGQLYAKGVRGFGSPMPSSSRPGATSTTPSSCCGRFRPRVGAISAGPPISAPTTSTPSWLS